MEKEQKIYFATKAENNERRLREAAGRTPHERFIFFLKLCEELMVFETGKPHPNRAKNNFVVE
jgi:hypothetical protein